MTSGDQPAVGKPHSKAVLGLIGGIGSGKSMVAAELARRDGQVISGDTLGHEALRNPTIKAQILHRFGAGVFDSEGNVDRRRLGTRVFADPNERKALEDVVFPFIERGIGEGIAGARRNPEAVFVVLDAAIMLEAGWDKHCDRLIYVDADRRVRLERLARQRNWTERDLEAREAAQWPAAAKKCRADAVIENSGSSQEEVSRQVDEILREWKVGVPA